MSTTPRGRPLRSLLTAGVLLGIGLGGFVDGIVLHQILQWHHMLSAFDRQHYPMTTVAGLEVNTLWDGIFHSAMWIATVAGLAVLWWGVGTATFRWSTSAFIGAMLAGWGGFNLVEGVIDHHILGLHHVRDDLGAPPPWDIAFLALGVVLVSAGWALIRSGSRAPQSAAHRRTT